MTLYFRYYIRTSMHRTLPTSTHNILGWTQAITDLSAAGYIEGKRELRDVPGDGRRSTKSTLYAQVMKKLEKDGTKWLGVVDHLPDATIIELFKELAENMTSQDELIKDLQLDQLVTSVAAGGSGQTARDLREVDPEAHQKQGGPAPRRCHPVARTYKEWPLCAGPLTLYFSPYCSARTPTLSASLCTFSASHPTSAASLLVLSRSAKVIKRLEELGEELGNLAGEVQGIKGEVASLKGKFHALEGGGRQPQGKSVPFPNPSLTLAL